MGTEEKARAEVGAYLDRLVREVSAKHFDRPTAVEWVCPYCRQGRAAAAGCGFCCGSRPAPRWP